jgi:hypothetical protein
LQNINETFKNIKNRAVREKLIKLSKLKINDKVRVKIFKEKLDKSSTQNFTKSTYYIYKIIKPTKSFIQIKYCLKNNNNN